MSGDSDDGHYEEIVLIMLQLSFVNLQTRVFLVKGNEPTAAPRHPLI